MDSATVRAEAERLIKRGELREALAIYRDLAANDPGDAAAAARVKTLAGMVDGDALPAVGPRPAASGAAPRPAPASRREILEALLDRLRQASRRER